MSTRRDADSRSSCASPHPASRSRPRARATTCASGSAARSERALARTAAQTAVAAALTALMWARLERPARAGDFALMSLLAALPVLVPRFQLVVLVLAALVAARLAVHLSPHRFWQGFLGFYDVPAPFDPRLHRTMHGDLELAVFAFTAAAGLALATRRRFAAVLALLVGAGWPATLVGGGGQLLRGPLI